MEEGRGREAVPVEDSNQPLRSYVNAVFGEHQRAMSLAQEEREKEIRNLRESLIERIQSGDQALWNRLESFQHFIESGDQALWNRFDSLDKLYDFRISSLKELLEQYNIEQEKAVQTATEERANSADTLRNEQQRALDKADQERERAALALSQTLARQIESGDTNLRMHIEAQIAQVHANIQAQKDLVDTTFDASKEAIRKAENANEKRFESINDFRAQLGDQQRQLVPRELFEQAQVEHRRRSDALTDLVQNTSTRVAEIEARGGGEKDQAADFKSTVAIGIGLSAILVSGAISLLT
jgi:hypothetical protein